MAPIQISTASSAAATSPPSHNHQGRSNRSAYAGRASTGG